MRRTQVVSRVHMQAREEAEQRRPDGALKLDDANDAMRERQAIHGRVNAALERGDEAFALSLEATIPPAPDVYHYDDDPAPRYVVREVTGEQPELVPTRHGDAVAMPGMKILMDADNLCLIVTPEDFERDWVKV